MRLYVVLTATLELEDSTDMAGTDLDEYINRMTDLCAVGAIEPTTEEGMSLTPLGVIREFMHLLSEVEIQSAEVPEGRLN